MTLNPQAKALLDMFAQVPPIDLATMTAAGMREANDRPMGVGPPPHVAEVRDVSIPLEGRTLTARLYVPEGAGDKPPLTLYYHGGGWVIGTLETHDGTCRAIARASGSAILSVGYRLAPEHRYPAAPKDCFDSLEWAIANAASLGVDGERVAVAGDSAGGNLAAIVAIMARDHGIALRHQLLIYPVTDYDFSPASYAENGSGEYFLGTEMMRWFWHQYLGGCSTDDAPLATVMRTEDMAGLASATVVTAQYDPLRDEGMAYAAKLRSAGVAVEADIAPGMIHGFYSMFEVIPDALPWIEKGGAQLRAALA
jgi:acetyl esterase